MTTLGHRGARTTVCERGGWPFEAHDANEHLRSHREIVNVGGVPRLAALSSISSTGTMQFQFLNVMLDPFVDGRSGVGGADHPALSRHVSQACQSRSAGLQADSRI